LKHIGLITAFLSEGTALLGSGRWSSAEGLFFRHQKLALDKKLLCVVSGMGQDAARKGVSFLLKHGATEILNAGVAAGLVQTLVAGDVVFAASIEELGGLSINIDLEKKSLFKIIASNKYRKLRTGKILTVTKPLKTRAEKIKVYEKTGAIAADMESLWVGLEAENHKIAFSAFRSISDVVDTTLTFDPSEVVDPFGRLRVKAFLRVIQAEPQLLLTLPALYVDYAKSLRALRRAWKLLLPFF